MSRDSGVTAALPDASWKPLYTAGSVLALAYVVMVIVPIILIFTTPQPPSAGGRAVLEYIASHRWVYVTELVCFVGLSIPALGVFLAVAVSLKDVNKSLAALGGLAGIVSETLALGLAGSPESLHTGLVYLSGQYAATASEAGRLALATAAEGFIASVNAVSPIGVLTALAILLLSICMLRGVFARGVAVLGIVAGVAGIILESIRPIAGMFYMIYGLLLPAWFVAAGLTLLARGRQDHPRGA